MENVKVKSKIGEATKWSLLTQIATKSATPITNMILARILIPEDFGVVVTVTMVTSFVDIFTDAGFQKYLIQNDFKDKEEMDKYSDVAFWTNLVISMLFMVGIIIYRDKIANISGSNGFGNAIAIASIQLPITAFSSIQEALYKREFNFKGIFMTQLIVSIIPLIVTVPLALLGARYWSIIIGNIISILIKAILLMNNSKWKPQIFYSVYILKKMLSYSIWMLGDSITVWLISWVDTLIITANLTDYYIGLYKNSLSMVNSIMLIISASIAPVLFSALSRLKNKKNSFENMFLNTQKTTAYLLFPLGIGLYFYRHTATQIIFGNKWTEAADIIGIWALTTALRIVLVSLYSEVYRAKGKPRLCIILQIIDLIILVPICLISVKSGFWSLVYSRAISRLILVIPGIIIMHKIIKIDYKKIIKNLINPTIYTIIISFIIIIFKNIYSSLIVDIFSVGLIIIIYFIIIKIFSKDDFDEIFNVFKNKQEKKV